ncbi:unnamed protein product [Adineta ricciae]|uniref:Uncharacterized protein n=1 Tax=Adineta ricciae TaxID=249248 RepID=A0A815GTD5_ADIRI|nr:unnamed protein product [Adineta ricciae]
MRAELQVIQPGPRSVTPNIDKPWTPNSSSDLLNDRESKPDKAKRSIGAWLKEHACCCCIATTIILLLLIAALIVGLVVGLKKSDDTSAATATINYNTTTSTSTTSTSATTTTVTTTTTSTASTSTTSSTSSTSTSTTTTSTATTTTATTNTLSTTTTTATTSTTTSTATTTTTSTATTTSTSATTTSTSATTSTATTTSTSATTSTATTTTSTATTTSTSATTTTTTTTKPVCTTQVTFDDISGQSSSSGTVPNGYKNLNWVNTVYINASSAPIGGLRSIVPASSYVAYNPGGSNITISSANGSSFSFDSITWTSAWRSGLNISIALFRLGSFRLGTSRTVFAANSTLFQCTVCTNIDTIVLSAGSGTPYSGLSQNGTEMVIDNLCISFGY